MVQVHSLVAAALGVYLLPSVSAWGFPYGSQKVRGVNLGGWLVLEPWITPSIFDNTGDTRIVDEWTFGLYQDSTTALNTLKNHWNTWITESDFAAIAAAGSPQPRAIANWILGLRSRIRRAIYPRPVALPAESCDVGTKPWS
ncbi:hypothetical protein AX15_000634 [Amanita polypyramis BW_CC]|nr:hypothetical protein AX15_000634 [Amanita polypyramis BW_CC]